MEFVALRSARRPGGPSGRGWPGWRMGGDSDAGPRPVFLAVFLAVGGTVGVALSRHLPGGQGPRRRLQAARRYGERRRSPTVGRSPSLRAQRSKPVRRAISGRGVSRSCFAPLAMTTWGASVAARRTRLTTASPNPNVSDTPLAILSATAILDGSGACGEPDEIQSRQPCAGLHTTQSLRKNPPR